MQSTMKRRLVALSQWKQSAALSRRDQTIARLDEQGASKERVCVYSRRWLGWAWVMGMAVVVMMMGEGGLVGCAMTLPSGQKAIADSEMRKRIVVGMTTKGEVEALLGEPHGIMIMDEGEEAWSYSYTAGGQVLGIASEMTMTALTIRFTKEGVVKEKGYGRGELR